MLPIGQKSKSTLFMVLHGRPQSDFIYIVDTPCDVMGGGRVGGLWVALEPGRVLVAGELSGGLASPPPLTAIELN